MAMFALRWILMNEAVSVIIPGAKNKTQAESNARASDIPALSEEIMDAMNEIYQNKIAPYVHQRW